MNGLAMFGALCVAHAVCDYPLQGDFLSRAKNRSAPIPGVPWYQAMGAHALMHAGAVWWLTGLWWLGALEFFAHAVTDDAKCRGRLSFNQDQAIHIACKLLWALTAWTLANV
jgi:hypothetical protein